VPPEWIDFSSFEIQHVDTGFEIQHMDTGRFFFIAVLYI